MTSVIWNVKSPIGAANGMIAQETSAAMKPKKGAMVKMNRSTPAGTVSSLKMDLRPSAARCSVPRPRKFHSPGRLARLGPIRSCTALIHLRSISVSNVPAIMTNPSTTTAIFSSARMTG